MGGDRRRTPLYIQPERTTPSAQDGGRPAPGGGR
jgi:hypothetical protein